MEGRMDLHFLNFISGLATEVSTLDVLWRNKNILWQW